MTNLGCHHDCIWSQWKPKVLGSPVWSIFLIRLLQAGRPILDFGWTFWWPSTSKDTGQGSVGVLPAFSYSSSWQVYLSCCYPVLNATSSGFQCNLKTSSSPEILKDSSPSLGVPSQPAFWMKQLLILGPFFRRQSVLDYPDHTDNSQALWQIPH